MSHEVSTTIQSVLRNVQLVLLALQRYFNILDKLMGFDHGLAHGLPEDSEA